LHRFPNNRIIDIIAFGASFSAMAFSFSLYLFYVHHHYYYCYFFCLVFFLSFFFLLVLVSPILGRVNPSEWTGGGGQLGRRRYHRDNSIRRHFRFLDKTETIEP